MAKSKFAMRFRLYADDELTPALRKLRRRANKTFKAIGKSSLRASKSIAKIGIASGIAAAAGVAKLTLDYATFADELAKFSKQTGLSVESLQELGFAAERLGVPNETLRKSFEKLSRNIGDARKGQGEMVTIMKKAAPALLEELKAVESTEEGFNLMVNALDAIPDAADKASLAQAVFGRAGQKLIRITGGGTKELEKYRVEARRYGLITAEQAAAAEVFKDEQLNLTTALLGVRNEFAGPLIKALTPYVTKLQEWVVANRSIITSRIVETAEGFVGAMSKLDWAEIGEGASSFAGSLVTIAENLEYIGQISGGLFTAGAAIGEAGDFLSVRDDISLPMLQKRLAEERARLGLPAFAGTGTARTRAGGAVKSFPGVDIPAPPTRQASIANAQNLLNPATQVSVTLIAPAGTSVDSVFTSPGAKVTMKGAQRTTGGKR